MATQQAGVWPNMSLVNTLNFILTHPLNRKRRFASMVDFFKWQVASRMIPGDIIHEWINGSKFIVRKGETGLTGNVYAGLHEFTDMAFLLHFLRSNDLFVDVGANAGSYSILAASVIGAKTVAFEPVPSTFSRLKDNMRINHLDNRMRCLNKGLGASVGEISFSSADDTTNHVLAGGENRDDCINVLVTTLNDELKDQLPSLIKIDVEGYETSVIQGGSDVLRMNCLKAIIMELNGSANRYGFDEDKIVDLLKGNGFMGYSYEPFGRQLSPIEGKNPQAGNTLFIRDREIVAERVKTAPSITVCGIQV